MKVLSTEKKVLEHKALKIINNTIINNLLLFPQFPRSSICSLNRSQKALKVDGNEKRGGSGRT
jgi:hypothetical protein